MNSLKDNIKLLCTAFGVAGAENNAAKIAAELLEEFTQDVTIDKFSNVIGIIKSKKNAAAKTILLDAHIDEIGMIVTAIDDKGFVKFANCGGIDRRLLSAQEVLIHTKSGDILGVVGAKPPHLEKAEEAKKIPPIDEMFIDIGFDKTAASERVDLGDRITIRSNFHELLNNRVSVKSLDDRCGVAAILQALKQLEKEELDCNLAVLFSAQEEIGGAGATVASFDIAPDVAIAVDVSFAFTSDAEEDKCGKMGSGVMIGVSALLDKSLSDELINIAKEKQIPYQIEVITGRSTGTNADSMKCTKSGVKTSTLSIPQKYMHTPIEVVDLFDLQATADLIAAYVLAQN